MRLLLIGGVGIVMGLGIVIGMPIGVAAYFWLLAEADKQGGIGATYENEQRIKEQREKYQ